MGYPGPLFRPRGDAARSAHSLSVALDHLEADVDLCTAIGTGVIERRAKIGRFEKPC